MTFQSRQKKRLAEYALERYGVKGHVLPYEPDPYSVASPSGGMTIGFIGWLLRWPSSSRLVAYEP